MGASAMTNIPRLYCFTAIYSCLSFLCLECLVVPEVQVPKYLMLGETAKLKCIYNLQDDILYSLTWWKDGSQFLQYKPGSATQYVVFSVPGANVSRETLSAHTVDIVSVTAASSGQYRCELVGEGPPFKTTFSAANLSVIHTPHGPPVIRGLKEIYHDGDTISLTCTSYRSYPPTQLHWSVREFEDQQEIKEKHPPQAFASQSRKEEYLRNAKLQSLKEDSSSQSIPSTNTRRKLATPIPFTYSEHKNVTQKSRKSGDKINFKPIDINGANYQHSTNDNLLRIRRSDKASSLDITNKNRYVHFAKKSLGWKEVKTNGNKMRSNNEQYELASHFQKDATPRLDSHLHSNVFPQTITSSSKDSIKLSHTPKIEQTADRNTGNAALQDAAKFKSNISSKRQSEESRHISKFRSKGLPRIHYYRAPRDGRFSAFKKVAEEFTTDLAPVIESIWSEEEEKSKSGDLLSHSMPQFLYTNSLSIKLPVTRSMAHKRLISLRCTATIHLYESSTAVQVNVAPLQVSEPHHLPTLLNKAHSPNQPSSSWKMKIQLSLNFFSVFFAVHFLFLR